MSTPQEQAAQFAAKVQNTAGQGFKPAPKSDRPHPQPQPQPAANGSAIATQTQQVVGAIRDTAHSQRQRLDALAQQVDLTAEVVADQYAELLDPRNIEARIAAKVVDRLGKLEAPTPLEELDMSEVFGLLTIPKFTLPSSFGRSPQLAGASGNSINSNNDTNAA